jgi:hypothetical protein
MEYKSATEIQALVRNMDDSKKRWRLLKTRNPQEYERRVGEENKTLFNDFYTIFRAHLEDRLDATFFYMLQMRRKIEKGEMTEDEAATQVGQKLFDRWVAPVVSNAPPQATQSYEEYYKSLSQ